MNKKIITNSPQETEDAAQILARQLTGGGVMALEGELGSGKTVFVKGIARELGIKHIIQSPTFVLMKVYAVDRPTIKLLVHVDCYRLDAGQALSDIGLDDYLDDPAALIVIEWADKVAESVPDDAVNVKLSVIDESKREIFIQKV